MRKVLRPGGRLSDDLDVPLIGLDLGVDVLDAICGRDLALLEGHGDLDDAGQAGCSLGVTEVALDGADQEGSALGLLEDTGHGLNFDRVTHGCTSSMALNVVGLVEAKTSLGIGLADDGFLTISARQGNAIGLAVGVDGSTTDDGADRVSVTDGITEPLNEDGADTISSAVTIGRRVKGVTSGGLGKDTSLHGGELLLRRLDKVGTSHDGGVAFSCEQGGNSRMQAVKRGRASSVDDEAGTLHVEHMTDSVGQDGGTQTSRGVSVGVLGILELHGDEVGDEVADIATDVGVRDLIQREAGVLERLEDHLKQLALLGVHVCGLEVVDAEEGVLEPADVVLDEVAALHVERARTVRVGVVEAVDVEARRWEAALGGTPGLEELPELGCGVASTGQTTS